MDVDLIPKITANLPVTSEHIADIITIAQEGAWLKEEESLTNECNKLNERLEAAKAQMRAAAEAMGKSIKKENQALVRVLRNTGFDVRMEVVVEPSDRPMKARCTISISGNNSHYYNTISTGVMEIDASESMVSAMNLCSDIERKISSVQASLIKVKRNLGNVERLRRLAKAKIGIEVLNKTKEGRELLAQLGVQDVGRLLPCQKE